MESKSFPDVVKVVQKLGNCCRCYQSRPKSSTRAFDRARGPPTCQQHKGPHRSLLSLQAERDDSRHLGEYRALPLPPRYGPEERAQGSDIETSSQDHHQQERGAVGDERANVPLEASTLNRSTTVANVQGKRASDTRQEKQVGVIENVKEPRTIQMMCNARGLHRGVTSSRARHLQ